MFVGSNPIAAIVVLLHMMEIYSLLTITCPNSTIEIQDVGLKKVQS